MTAEHNHPPRCCCISVEDEKDDPTRCRWDRCPACIEHGELAAAIECPQCHQPIGRPHTDFCTLAPGKTWDGVLPNRAPGHWLYPLDTEPEHRTDDVAWHAISTCTPDWCGSTPRDHIAADRSQP